MGKVQSDTTEKMNRHGRAGNGSPAWDLQKADVKVYGPQEGGGTPCVIVRPGTDPRPTCVNPQCPKADNCRKHIANRTAEGTPSIAIITWYRCSHYDPIDPEKYKEKEDEQKSSDTTTA